MALPLAIFAAVLLIFVGTYWLLVVYPERSRGAGLKRRLLGGLTPKAKRAAVIKEAERLSTLPALDHLLARRRDAMAPLATLLRQSGVRTTLGVILLTTGLLALVGLLMGQFLFRSVPVGVVFACLLCPAPVLFLLIKRQRRTARFEELFPEAMDLLARAMRAGHTFPTGLGMVADEMPDPISAEFRLLFDMQNYGAPVAEALRDFARRVPLLDARIFVTAVLTQREAGGNLAEVLDNLASVVRRRFVVKRQIRAKSAHGRLTGWVLIGLPPALALTIFVMNPGYMRPLVSDPVGVRLVIIGSVLQVIGTIVIRRLVRIDY